VFPIQTTTGWPAIEPNVRIRSVAALFTVVTFLYFLPVIMSSEINVSPKRNPNRFDNGQYTQSLHPSRGDLRLALEEDKLEFLK
jgi:hypothetical protein